MNTKNHPGVYIPPPLIYVAFFLLSLVVQNLSPLNNRLLHLTITKSIGMLMIALYLVFFITALRRFILSKNTLITIRPAHSLETSGVYSFTRNPMYVSLVCLYSGLAIFFGNWWAFIFLPLLVMVVQLYVIRKEEQYLQQAFGSSYHAYKKKVRRWI